MPFATAATSNDNLAHQTSSLEVIVDLEDIEKGKEIALSIARRRGLSVCLKVHEEGVTCKEVDTISP